MRQDPRSFPVMARLTSVTGGNSRRAVMPRGWLYGAGLAAALSLHRSCLRGFGTKPKGEGGEALRGAGYSCAARVGAGHPPPKADPSDPTPQTCLPLEKWEGFSDFAPSVVDGGCA